MKKNVKLNNLVLQSTVTLICFIHYFYCSIQAFHKIYFLVVLFRPILVLIFFYNSGFPTTIAIYHGVASCCLAQHLNVHCTTSQQEAKTHRVIFVLPVSYVSEFALYLLGLQSCVSPYLWHFTPSQCKISVYTSLVSSYYMP